MQQIDVGDGSAAAPDMVALGVSSGQTITVSNLAGGNTLNLFTNGIDQAPTTLNAGSQTTVSTPGTTFIQCASGVTSVQLFGGLYG